MKKVLLFLVPFCFISILFAQKPSEGDRQISLGIMNNSGYVIYKKYTKDNKARRFGVNGSFDYSNDYLGNYNYLRPGSGAKFSDTKYSGSYGVSYGFQKNFEGLEKIEPYIGLDFLLKNSFGKEISSVLITDSSIYQSPSYHNGDYDNITTVQSVNLGLTLKPLLGVNYYLSKNFAIGAEYAFSIFSFSYLLGGMYKEEKKLRGVQIPNVNNKTENGFDVGTGFSGLGGITLSYWFK